MAVRSVLILTFIYSLHAMNTIDQLKSGIIELIDKRIHQGSVKIPPPRGSHNLRSMIIHFLTNQNDDEDDPILSLAEIYILLSRKYKTNQDEKYYELISDLSIGSFMQKALFGYWLEQKILKYQIPSIIDNQHSVKIITTIMNDNPRKSPKYRYTTGPLWNNFIINSIAHNLAASNKSHDWQCIKIRINELLHAYLNLYEIGKLDRYDAEYLHAFDAFYKNSEDVFKPSMKMYYDIITANTSNVISIDIKEKYFKQWLLDKHGNIASKRLPDYFAVLIFNSFLRQLLYQNAGSVEYKIQCLSKGVNYWQTAIDIATIWIDARSTNLLLFACQQMINKHIDLLIINEIIQKIHDIWFLLSSLGTDQARLVDDLSRDITTNCVHKCQGILNVASNREIINEQLSDIARWSKPWHRIDVSTVDYNDDDDDDEDDEGIGEWVDIITVRSNKG